MYLPTFYGSNNLICIHLHLPSKISSSSFRIYLQKPLPYELPLTTYKAFFFSSPPPKFSKGDHSKKIANIFGLDDTPSDSHVVSKPQDKPPSSASDWLGLTDSPQKKSDDYFGSPQKKSTMENILGSQTNLSQKSTPPTRRKSEVPLNQSKKWEKTLTEYKSLDLGLESGEGQSDISRVQIKENLMDPAVARGSRRSSLKIDSILVRNQKLGYIYLCI